VLGLTAEHLRLRSPQPEREMRETPSATTTAMTPGRRLLNLHGPSF
jgi:hypothetical protein